MQKIRKYILSVTNRDGKQEIWTSYEILAEAYGFNTTRIYNEITNCKKRNPEEFKNNRTVLVEGLKIKKIEQNVKFGDIDD